MTGKASAGRAAFKQEQLRQSHWEDLDEVVPVRSEDVPRQQRSIVSRVLVLSQLVLSLGGYEEAHCALKLSSRGMSDVELSFYPDSHTFDHP